MSTGLAVGDVLPDFTLPDETGRPHALSAIQGDDALVVLLGRGEHCPRERQHQIELLKLAQWVPVAFTRLVTILPNDLHDTGKMKMATGAWWPFLSDGDYEVQAALGIHEYTDDHHRATVPHTVILEPGSRTIAKVYCGYWYWGRPSSYQLWLDLQEVFRATKADFDPTTPEARAAWEASRGS